MDPCETQQVTECSQKISTTQTQPKLHADEEELPNFCFASPPQKNTLIPTMKKPRYQAQIQQQQQFQIKPLLKKLTDLNVQLHNISGNVRSDPRPLLEINNTSHQLSQSGNNLSNLNTNIISQQQAFANTQQLIKKVQQQELKNRQYNQHFAKTLANSNTQ
eukprot:TRINITY_DN42932_c0_g1_i1.p2 TRINITY_DN42932_c0_g1~~TRINITY_DN42932_c0_g1_i1.p2  ORF type:complete len:161 (-),score=26.21 TRINITY_DN42932_c0_g1_i1:122-604(-)